MATLLPICQPFKLGLSSVKILERLTTETIIAHSSKRAYGSDRCNCDCPQREAYKKDPKDTDQECEDYKKHLRKSHTEHTCRVNEWNCYHRSSPLCDPMECKLEKIEDKSPIPKEVFAEDPPCLPFEGDGFENRNKCEIAELKRCYTRNPVKAHLCRSTTPACLNWEKTYPMRHAGTKPQIDGRPLIGVQWKKKKWGYQC